MGPVLCVFVVLAISDVHTLVFCVVSWLELSVGVVVDVFAFSFCVLLLLATLLCTLWIQEVDLA